jgi:hypothetical protein
MKLPCPTSSIVNSSLLGICRALMGWMKNIAIVAADEGNNPFGLAFLASFPLF